MTTTYAYFISVYHCGSDVGWSDVFSFTALNDSASFSPRFALYGDLGNENPQSLARLQKETQLDMYDAILHIGKLHTDGNITTFHWCCINSQRGLKLNQLTLVMHRCLAQLTTDCSYHSSNQENYQRTNRNV